MGDAKKESAVTKSRPMRRYFEVAMMVLLPVLLFGYTFGLSLNYSLNDPDVWWHLKTGQYIVNNWEMPDEDPFAYTTPKPLGEGAKEGLRVQWLGQVVFYTSFLLGGYTGLGVFRGILIVLPMLFLYIWLVRKKLNPWAAFIIASPAALMYAVQLFYSFERPQGLTFFFSIVVAALIERLRSFGRDGHQGANRRNFDYSFIALPALMALWSNIHAGYVIGDVIIIIYAAGEILRMGYRALSGKKLEAGPYLKSFFAVVIASVLASFINPNGHVIFKNYAWGLASMFFSSVARTAGGEGGGWVESVVLEYKSLWYFYKNLDYKWLIFYWIFIGALYLFMVMKYWRKRSVDLAELAVVTIITVFANYYARGLMISLAVLPFYFGKTVVELDLRPPKWKNAARAAVAVVLVLTIGFYGFTYTRMPYILKPGVTTSWITPWYPIRIVEFLQATEIDGPMYNFYTWGGFLIWTLYPKYKVFIDGRALDDLVNRTADAILKTFPGWEEKLDAYSINFIVIPVIFRESGHIIPLAVTLARHGGWKLVFLKHNGAVFVRDIPKNASLISTFDIDKQKIFEEIVMVENIFLSASPWNPVYNIAKADALMALGSYDEARAIYERFPNEGAMGLRALKDIGH